MFYSIKVKDFIRVPPSDFEKPIKDSIWEEAEKKYKGFISKELGIVVGIGEITNIGEGIIIPGDGAAHYETEFTILSFKPELKEVVPSFVTDITNFGAFLALGPIDGMVHLSQAMDDFVSFSKEKVLQGRDKKRSLKVGDEVRAEIIAVSYKDIANPKIGLTMRRKGLGKLEWIEEDLKKKK